MSVQTELDRIIGLVDDSHEAVKAKGGTTTTPHLLANLPEAIGSIPTGEDLSAEITEYGSLNDELEEVINSLPSAGGASVETCTVTHSDLTPPGLVVYYVDESLQLREATSFPITVLKNSIIYAEHYIHIISGNATAIGNSHYSAFVGGDCDLSMD